MPKKNADRNEIISFSLVSKSFLSKTLLIRPPNVNKTINLKIEGLKENEIAKFTNDSIIFSSNILSKLQIERLNKVCKIIQSYSVKNDASIKYSITSINHIKNSLFRINVKGLYCLIEKECNDSNRVYFIHDINTTVIRFKCFSCGYDKFYDILIDDDMVQKINDIKI